MASDVDICNTGLSHLGARAQVAAISPPDGSVESGYCARFYPIARRELIETHNWSFAKARAVLAETTNTSTVWEFAYALPSDCVMALRVLDQLVEERDSSAFEIENGVLRTNEAEAVLLYKRDVTDTSKYTPTFVSALGMLLASYLAGPIIKGMDGAKVGAQWREAAAGMAKRAVSTDANASQESNDHTPAHLAVR